MIGILVPGVREMDLMNAELEGCLGSASSKDLRSFGDLISIFQLIATRCSRICTSLIYHFNLLEGAS